jgi:hypothetical protein
MMLGPLMEKNKRDSRFVDLMKNKDVFCMDYSSKKEEADKNIAQWIRITHELRRPIFQNYN